MKNNENLIKKNSYLDAVQIIKELREKPRSQWSEKERLNFRKSNFKILSKKRLNKIIEVLLSFKKLNNKSHYKFNLEELEIMRELIINKLDETLTSFFKELEIIKTEDAFKIQIFIKKIIHENERLRQEVSQYKKELNIYKRHSRDEPNDFLKNILMTTRKEKQSIRYSSKVNVVNKKSKRQDKTVSRNGQSPRRFDKLLSEEIFNSKNTKKRKFKL